MEVLLKLYSTIDKATDGSRIPRDVTEAYLQSKDYQHIIENKLGLGGVTHKDRTLNSEYKGLIGQDDQVIINNNATHYFKKIFFKSDQDPFVYAIIEVFNPDDFAGKQRDNIINLLGLLKSGVKLPVSIVIHAIWDERTDEAKRIIRIKGVDFTQNNAFPNAGVLEVGEEIKTESRTYSMPSELAEEYPDCSVKEKSFSAVIMDKDFKDPGDEGSEGTHDEGTEGKKPEGSNSNPTQDLVEEVQKQVMEKVAEKIDNELNNTNKPEESTQKEPSPEDMEPKTEDAKTHLPVDTSKTEEKKYSRQDIIRIYGLNSVEADVAKQFGELTESQLKGIQNANINHDRLVNMAIKDLLHHIGDDGKIKDFLKEYCKERGFDFEGIDTFINTPQDRSALTTVLRSVPTTDPNWRSIMAVGLDRYFRCVPRLAQYSSINSIKDRIYIFKYPRITVINRLLRYYKLYWNQFGKSMTDEDKMIFAEIIIEDLRVLLNKVSDKLEQGISLNSLYGLSQFNSTEIMDAASDLTTIFRKIIISQKILKFIPANQYAVFKSCLIKFYQACINFVTSDNGSISIDGKIRIIN